MSESEGSNLECLTNTSNSSPFQQVPVNEPHAHGCLNFDIKNGDSPYLVILVEPQELFRFRYKSETGKGSHGYLQGESLAPKSDKTYPTVELKSYKGAAVIKCQLYQHDKLVEHPHSLYEESRGEQEPKALVSEEVGYTVCFKKLGIIQPAQKELPGQLYNKLEKRLTKEEFEKLDKRKSRDRKTKRGQRTRKSRKRKGREVKTLQWLRDYCKSIDLNRVRLRFSAHDPKTDKELCAVFSRTILNLKSAETNMLKICRSSRATGKADGGEEVMLFVEKVKKAAIRVIFFEENSDGIRIWNAEAPIVEVHRQYGICFRTPPYKNPKITSHVKVKVELQRKKDGSCSAPIGFCYSPVPRYYLNRKRARIETVTSLPPATSVVPTVVPAEITYHKQYSTSSENQTSPESLDFNPNANFNKENLEQEVQDDIFSLLPFDAVDAYTEPTKPDPLCDAPFQRPDPEIMTGAQLDEILAQMPNECADYYAFTHNDLDSLLDHYLPFGDDDPSKMDTSHIVTDGPQPVNKVKAEFNMCDDSNLKYEDNLTIQTQLITEINELKKKKLQEWYEEVTEKLERLFEVKLANGETILHVALVKWPAGARWLVTLASALRRPDLLDARDALGLTALHHAVYLGQRDAIAYLIEAGADPLCGDVDGNNALHHAVLSGGDALEPLLEGIARACDHHPKKIQRKLDSTNKEWQTPLWTAVSRGDAAEARRLLAAGAGLSADCAGRSPLHVAVELDRPDLLRLLLDSQPEWRLRLDIDYCLSNYTPLQTACVGPEREHSCEIIELLLDYGADPVGSTHSLSEAAWRLARRAGGARCSALRRRLQPHPPHPPHPPHLPDRAASDSDDDFHSADDGDSETSENDEITTKLEAVKLTNNQR